MKTAAEYDLERYYKVKSDPALYEAYLARKTAERRRRQIDKRTETLRKREWRSRNRNKAKAMAAAHFAVEMALKRGELIKPETCSRCGDTGKIEGHHSSYAPEDRLKILWLCVDCHHKEHRAVPTEQEPQT